MVKFPVMGLMPQYKHISIWCACQVFFYAGKEGKIFITEVGVGENPALFLWKEDAHGRYGNK